MAVKNLGILTLDKVKKLTQSKNNDKKSIELSNATLEDRVLALIDQTSENNQINHSKHAESTALDHQVAISDSLLKPLSDHSFFEQAERQRMEKMNEQSKKFSIAMQEERERKEKLEKDRHDQLVSALERSNNQQTLADENAQLKAEIEKLKLENKQLKKIKENLGTKESDNVLKIVTILADMAGLPKLNPSTAFNMMEAHAANKGLEIPSSNTVTKWLKG